MTEIDARTNADHLWTGSALPSLLFPSLLAGAEVSRGNLRGTALVVLLVGVPLLAAGTIRTAQRSARALVLYVGFLGFGIWTLLALLADVDVGGFAARLDQRLPVTFTDRPSSVLDGSGLQTSPVWIQDLAFWIPAALLGALWLWRGRPWGAVLTGSMLTFYAIECLSIASDQWWGVRADAHQPGFASAWMIPAFLALAAVTAVPLCWYLRNLDRGRPFGPAWHRRRG